MWRSRLPVDNRGRVTGLTEAKAALERGRPVVLVTPPAVEQAEALWELVGPGPMVIVCADPAAAADWVSAAPDGRHVHPVTGLARSARLLQAGAVDILAGAVPDLTALVSRSALKLESVPTIVVAWPEPLVHSELSAALDTLLAEARAARRIVLSWNPALLEDFLERHAHRAAIAGGPPPATEMGGPIPVRPARYAIVPPAQRSAAAREALDQLNPRRAYVWCREARYAERLREVLGEGGKGKGETAIVVDTRTPDETCDAVLCAQLPNWEEFAALARHVAPVVFVTASQLRYLRSIAAPLTTLRLPAAADRARDRAAALRERIATLLDEGNVDAELALLEPLFERFDPAEVAAGLLAVSHQPLAVSAEPPAVSPQPSAAWVKVFVTVGKKDRAGAKDLVGALIKEVGLAKSDIGRIEVRETFSLVEIAPHAAETVVRGLTGVTIKGRRVAARFERQG